MIWTIACARWAIPSLALRPRQVAAVDLAAAADFRAADLAAAAVVVGKNTKVALVTENALERVFVRRLLLIQKAEHRERCSVVML